MEAHVKTGSLRSSTVVCILEGPESLNLMDFLVCSFDRDWRKIEEYVGTKTVIQVRNDQLTYF